MSDQVYDLQEKIAYLERERDEACAALKNERIKMKDKLARAAKMIGALRHEGLFEPEILKGVEDIENPDTVITFLESVRTEGISGGWLEASPTDQQLQSLIKQVRDVK